MLAQSRKNWSRDETLMAFNLFCRIPFGRIHKTNPEIVELARKLLRSPGSVVMKMGNLASFDPHLRKRGVKGLRNASKLDAQIWEEFKVAPREILVESQRLLDAINRPLELPLQEEGGEEWTTDQRGEDKEALVKTRIGQRIFRDTILASYREKCCVTGIAKRELLIASHIIPWRTRLETRLDPRNGLCLNALHDKAYDHGLISVRPDFTVAVSERLHKAAQDSEKLAFIVQSEGKKIQLPEKFAPSEEFLAFHYQKIFADSAQS
ncbi:MAG: HNH endonuclease [Gammaproteobacteria bacterium]|nr:HNH endonuclease [Gammaproteobacteria bacterium]MDD9870840.1 HNH endonuclease [Gammaproteobacteria bacterium]